MSAAHARDSLPDAQGSQHGPEFWLHTGYKNGNTKRRIPARNQGKKKAPDSRGLKGRSVELIGIEPTASRVRF